MSSRPPPSGSVPPNRRVGPSERPRSPTEEAWANGRASDPAPPAQASGRKFVTWFVAIIAAATVLALFARYEYRGDHDTNEGLALKPPPLPTASAASAPKPTEPSSIDTAATPPSIETAATPPPIETAATPPPIETAAAPTAPPTIAVPTTAVPTTAVPVTASSTAAAAPAVPTTATARPHATNEAASAPAPTAPSAPATQGGLSSESITQAAQRALEGKDKDEKQGTRAVQLAFLATQQDPGNADAWLTLGAAYEAMGKKQQAIESYRSCARKASAHPRVSDCRKLAGIKD